MQPTVFFFLLVMLIEPTPTVPVCMPLCAYEELPEEGCACRRGFFAWKDNWKGPSVQAVHPSIEKGTLRPAAVPRSCPPRRAVVGPMLTVDAALLPLAQPKWSSPAEEYPRRYASVNTPKNLRILNYASRRDTAANGRSPFKSVRYHAWRHGRLLSRVPWENAAGNPSDPRHVAHLPQCNCKNSRCLKLYCECFSSGEYCTDCNCVNCENNSDHEQRRKAAVLATLERNPRAFRPKIGAMVSKGALTIDTRGCSTRPHSSQSDGLARDDRPAQRPTTTGNTSKGAAARGRSA